MYRQTIFSTYHPDITGYTIVTSIETGVCGAIVDTGTGMIGINIDGMTEETGGMTAETGGVTEETGGMTAETGGVTEETGGMTAETRCMVAKIKDEKVYNGGNKDRY
jgi:hypothetical protein